MIYYILELSGIDLTDNPPASITNTLWIFKREINLIAFLLFSFNFDKQISDRYILEFSK